MFDIAFSELLVIGVVALIVIGPERLPKVARTAGQWLGRLNRYVSQVKQDIDRDIKLEELRKLQQDMKESAQKYEILAKDTARQVETEVGEQTTQISRAMEGKSASDGGLASQEHEKIKAEQAAATPEAGTSPVPADVVSGVVESPDTRPPALTPELGHQEKSTHAPGSPPNAASGT